MTKHDALLTWRIGTFNPRPANARALADSLACENLPREQIPDRFQDAVTAYRHLRRDARERVAEAALRESVSLAQENITALRATLANLVGAADKVVRSAWTDDEGENGLPTRTRVDPDGDGILALADALSAASDPAVAGRAVIEEAEARGAAEERAKNGGCPECRGTGNRAGRDDRYCNACDGTGRAAAPTQQAITEAVEAAIQVERAGLIEWLTTKDEKSETAVAAPEVAAAILAYGKTIHRRTLEGATPLSSVVYDTLFEELIEAFRRDDFEMVQMKARQLSSQLEPKSREYRLFRELSMSVGRATTDRRFA